MVYNRETDDEVIVHNSPIVSKTTYEYTKPNHNLQEDRAHARLMMRYTAPHTETRYPKNYEYSQDWVDRTTLPGNQIPLFTHSESPASNKVDFLSSTEAAKLSATTLLGIADYEAQLEGKPPVTPSHDLSKHSLRMVKKLEEKGVTSTHLDSPTNSVGFMSIAGSFPHTLSTDEKISQNTVKAGRKRVRDTLRPPKKQKQEPYEQLQFERLE